MLRIIIPMTEDYDEEASKFVISESVTLDLEHSLASLSKWESKWETPFLGYQDKTEDQTLDYIQTMIIGEIPPGDFLNHLTPENIKEIDLYINAKMTATLFNDREQPRRSQQIVTAELIYYWMITLGVPFECQYWHLSRLLALIRVCSKMNAPKKQRTGPSDLRANQAAINAQRRAQLGTAG